VKNFHDAEGKVVGHLPGAGRHEGRLGALSMILPDGTTFSVGTGFSDAEREAPPAEGSIVTFRYQELTDDGTPRFPSYLGVRHDLAWEQVQWPPPGSTPPPPPEGEVPAPLADDLSDVEPHAELPASMAAARAPALQAAPAAPPPEPEPEEPVEDVRRRVEYVGKVTTKVWQVDQQGTTVHIQRGRLGREMIHKSLSFQTAAEAAAYATKQVEAKLMKGYDEIFK